MQITLKQRRYHRQCYSLSTTSWNTFIDHGYPPTLSIVCGSKVFLTRSQVTFVAFIQIHLFLGIGSDNGDSPMLVSSPYSHVMGVC